MANFDLQEAKTYTYPENVASDEQPHSVVFYINARSTTTVGGLAKDLDDIAGGTRAFREAQRQKNEDYTNANRMAADNNEAEITATSALGTILGGIAGSKAGKAITNAIFGGGQSPAITFLGAAGGAGGGAYLANKALEGNLVASEMVRLLSVIQLHVASPPVSGYGARWDNADLGVAGGSLAALGEAAANSDGLGDFMNQAMETGAGSAIARSMIQGAASIPSQMGIGGDLGAAFDVASKQTLNPFKEQLFKFMEFRKFDFNYRFTPRNKTEFNNVMDIVHLFKYHMHPEKDDTNFFLKYPSEFVIEYHYKDGRNEYVNKIAPCALTNLQVQYGGQEFTTFADLPGAPAEINIKLSFSELEMLTTGTTGRVKESWVGGTY